MLDKDPLTWAGLVDVPGVDGVTGAGVDAVRWALDVHERFFGDAWLQRAAERRDVAFMRLGLWPVEGPGPVLRLVERACQLTLVETDWDNLRSQVHQNRPGEAVTHLRLVLETAGWGLRDGLTVEFEPDMGTGKKPDVRLRAGDGRDVLVEVTSQTQDQEMRAVTRYGRLVQDLTLALERQHGVVITAVSEHALDDDEVRAWFEVVGHAAGRVGPDDAQAAVPWAGSVATVHPGGTKVTALHTGPSVVGDAWPRLGRRISKKADQTRGGALAWIRVEVDASLFALTSLAALTPEARLRALAGNVAGVLTGEPHVLGVIIGPPPGMGAAGDERLLIAHGEDSTRSGLIIPASLARDRASASGPTAVRCS